MTVYALLVGIDDYAGAPLHGAVADIEQVVEYLGLRAPGSRRHVLLDGDATLGAVRAGLTGHLGRAGRGDVALFWFCGHGGEAPAGEHWRLEPTGLLQTLVCADSRRALPDGTYVPDLADKELGPMLGRLAARGAHVVVVLDCCHAGGATRGPWNGMTVRGLGPAPGPWPDVTVPGAADGIRAVESAGTLPIPDQVVLAACRLDEQAREMWNGTRVQGVFTDALLRALRVLEPAATYRELLAAVRGTVQDRTGYQTPTLIPESPGPADQPFLGGAIHRPAAFRMRFGRRGWEVDAGRCHGLPDPSISGELMLAVPGPETGPVRVLDVGPTACRVEPVGWQPDRERNHPVVVARVPVPRCAVAVGGSPDDDPDAVALVTEAISTAGPGGGPSPDVRLALASSAPDLYVAATVSDGRPVLRILRPDGCVATDDVEGHGPGAARAAVARLEHIARWQALRGLVNPVTGLGGAVRVEVLAAGDDEWRIPEHGTPLVPDRHGEVSLSYRRRDGISAPPRVFVRLRNVSQRTLWCLLIDMTDRYGADPGLFTSGAIGPGHVGPAYDGRPITVSLPPDRPELPGTMVRDWLKLVVSDAPLTAPPFYLPTLGEAARITSRSGGAVLTRDLRDDTGPVPGSDWATAVVPLVTRWTGP